MKKQKKLYESNLASNLRQLHILKNHPRTKTGLAESVIYDATIFTCEFYRNFDFHTFINIELSKHANKFNKEKVI